MADVYYDFVFATTVGSVSPGDTTVAVDDVSSFPSSSVLAKGDFYVTFESGLTHPNSFEVVKVTGVNTVSKVLTISAATVAHGIGTSIKATLTAAMLRRLRAGMSGTVVPTGTDPDLYTVGDPFLYTPTNSLYVYTTSGFVAVGSGSRQTATATTASLAPNAVDSVTTMPLSLGYRLYTIATSRPARVRLYTTAASRTSDLSRGVGVDPASTIGVVLDYVTPGGGVTYPLSPLVGGVSLESTPSASIPMTVTNNDTATGTVTVTFTWIKTE